PQALGLNETIWTLARRTCARVSAALPARLHLTMGVSQHWFERPDAMNTGSQWMTSAGYDLTSDLLAFATYAHKVRFPTIDQLFNPQQGNAALRPEQSDNYETGLAWTMAPTAQLRASVFHNDVNNFILNDSINQVFVNRDVTMSGFQISASYSPLPTLTFRPGYTYLDMRYPSSGLPVDYRPRDVVDLLVAYEPAPGLQLSADASYFADQSVGSKSNPAVRQALSDYAVVNAKLRKSLAMASAAMCAPPICSTPNTIMRSASRRRAARCTPASSIISSYRSPRKARYGALITVISLLRSTSRWFQAGTIHGRRA
ncbi:MAG: TonB-dependent receptor, partial [Bradyrhizobium sp.]|uniref:TonB-dependent receptor domain-containing protein n=1 Tax=Bradyrhizobium sp. TaxID=376 RepID=UPI00238AC011